MQIDADKLNWALAKLTPVQREVLEARAEGETIKSIAARLGMSYHTVRYHDCRACNRMAHWLASSVYELSVSNTERHAPSGAR
jgi:DNA-binding NarL/FixJ family response regulator